MPSASFTRYMVGFMGQRIRFEILRGIIRHPFGAICKAEGSSVIGEVPDTGAESVTYLYSWLFATGYSWESVEYTSNEVRMLLGGVAFLLFSTSNQSSYTYSPTDIIAANPQARVHFALYNDGLSDGTNSYHSRRAWSSEGTRQFGVTVTSTSYKNLMIFSLGEQ